MGSVWIENELVLAKTSENELILAKTSENEIVFDPIDAKPNHPKIKSYELLSIEISAS